MKINIDTLRKGISRLKAKVISADIVDNYESDQPLEAELFSSNQFKQYARILARNHDVDASRKEDKLLPRLSENEKILEQVYELLIATVKNNIRIALPGEWLIDNFYLFEEQVRTARQHFPKNYSNELPHLTKGPFEGYPRVYDIALQLISHSDGRVHKENLYDFVAAYQEETTLNLGELWAIPIMLRLALLENLRRVAVHIYKGRKDRDRAIYWSDRMLSAVEKDPKSLVIEIADLAKSDPDMSSAFVSELIRRMQGQSHHLVLPLTWIEQRLSDDGLKIEQLIQAESQHQASAQVSIGNSISSFRLLNAINWKEFVEKASSVHAILESDPSSIYGRMDFETRDWYRHVIENIAKNSGFTENEVASKTVELAAQNIPLKGEDDRMSHVGYYLIDRGLPLLENITQRHVSFIENLRRKIKSRPLLSYLGIISILSTLFSAVSLKYLGISEIESWLLYVGASLLFICFSNPAIAFTNWFITVFVRPGILPAMDYSKGIPETARTLVVVPTIVYNRKNIDILLEGLEIEYLANRDVNLHFGLLADFPDAPEEEMPGDEECLNYIKERIRRLNEKYEQDRNNIFYYFHRPRTWNPQESVWMGYERKRGKLEELNSFLTGKGFKDKRTVIEGNDIDILRQVKYVITLDADTHIPLDSASKLIGKISHPLNKAVYDEKKQRITDGYSILQPRMAINILCSNKSWFVRIFGGEPGIDPYTKVISDVYQDFFNEGSFIGKGIYNVEIFAGIIGNRFPENRILSHDLIEGCYARSALVNDVQFYEKYPFNYLDDVSRRRRWIRGDWQILSWLKSRVPGRTVHRTDNPLSLLSQWKIFDNLRRSITPAAMLVLLLAGWSVPALSLSVTLIAGWIMLTPALLSITVDLIKRPQKLSFRIHVFNILDSIIVRISQALFALVTLPYEALYSIHAVSIALIRTYGTHRKMLEWHPSASVFKKPAGTLIEFSRRMWIVPLVSAVFTVYFAVSHSILIRIEWILLGLWFFSPVIAWRLSKPFPERKSLLSASQTEYLRGLSRKTWDFFDTFVTKDTNWLPPDNYQEQPVEKIAYRTSPTNIGLYLLANLSALDFGYISSKQFLSRTKDTLDAMVSLERYRNHFYNWYDLKTMKPLQPLYVSTVDSGNLSGHLLVVESGLNELQSNNVFPPGMFDGLKDTLRVLEEKIDESGIEDNGRIRGIIKKLYADLISGPGNIKGISRVLENVRNGIPKLEAAIPGIGYGQVKLWATKLKTQNEEFIEDFSALIPWKNMENRLDNLMQANKELEKTLPERLRETVKKIYEETLTLEKIAGLAVDMSPLISKAIGSLSGAPDEASSDAVQYLEELRNTLRKGSDFAAARITEIKQLALRCDELNNADFGFLYDKSRRLMWIGYNVNQRRTDNSYYDLLASEARLVSYIAIAKRQLPVEHWFSLGRPLTVITGEPVLLSWGGSIFEYLMPLLVMPTYKNSLLDTTCKTVINKQIKYAAQMGIPWGISESGYNKTDAQFNYQYSAFGVPELGFKPGLAENLVVAPYASIMALMISPEKAFANLQRMSEEGYEGPYGFYEAVDYTPSRLPRGSSKAVIRSFMAHHQGMSFLSLANVLLGWHMQRRFGNNLSIKSAELLLQERVPRIVPFHQHFSGISGNFLREGMIESYMRIFSTPHTSKPEVHLLSNGTYNVMVSNAGGGYSHWKDLAVTRWREDITRDNWGAFCYIRDLTGSSVWSNTYQPALSEPKHYEAIFSQARAEFRRRDTDFETYTEIAVSPEDDIEIRRIRVTNRSHARKTVEFTSYAEVVLLNPTADELHPVFNNLFIQTEIIRSQQAILCTRRPSSGKENPPFLFHLMNVYGSAADKVSYETDRLKFIGRGRSVHNPQVINDSVELSNTEGFVLDPIVSIRCVVSIEPEQTVIIDSILGIAAMRDKAISLIEKYKDRHLSDRAFAMALVHGQVVIQQLNMTEAEAQLYGRLASLILYANPLWRANASILLKNTRGQSGLWGYDISGDFPIVLLKISDNLNVDIVRQLINAHAYWKRKGLTVDLMILNEDHSVYRQQLHDQIMGLVAASPESSSINNPGRIYVRRAEHMSEEDRVLIQTAAHIVIVDTEGTLSEQMEQRNRQETAPVLSNAAKTYEKKSGTLQVEERDLVFFNETGGFTRDGREYVIPAKPGQRTPMPWVNVLANPDFGTVISESGGAYTWSENAHEFRLTPWYNDPVSDTRGEAMFIRDEGTGRFWSPTPLPSGGGMSYVTRHGFGYSVFECRDKDFTSELTVYVSINDTVKFSALKIKNHSGRPRRLSIFNYCELVLGDLRKKNAMHVITEIDPKSGAIFARNLYNTEFPGRVVFLDVNEPKRAVTGDRNEFLSRNGTLSSPAAMKRVKLSGRVGPGLDPCAAMQVQIRLEDREEREIIFVFGSGKNIVEAQDIIQKSRDSNYPHAELEAVWNYWKHNLGTLYVETPDPSINVLANGWLLYQTLACRFFARSGYYQSGGAFGFRDQLQDSLALLYARPDLVREHILRCAARQFKEGDVQHWWHPPIGRGVRSHCSDDYLWLPLVVARYMAATGDTGILEEQVHFIEGRQLKQEEESYYDKPIQSEEKDSLYGHCVRAVKYSLKYGLHGLPLMGSGDWNDGMNLVGAQGAGESVWLGFFLYYVLTQFSDVAKLNGDEKFAEFCAAEADLLKKNIDTHGWNDRWYLRAYYDNGDLLGSAESGECIIDSIPQSWSILSGAGDTEKSRLAMDAVNTHLIDKKNLLVLLLKPPFDKTMQEPGYIKGYVPGIRENGGQYTHAAIWAIMAFARLGEARKAWELFEMINPVNRGKTGREVSTYKVEPYVMAADVYANPQHSGQGGWTWYTGSAGWMYQLIFDSFIGLKVETDKLSFHPLCLPEEWKSFKLHYRYRETFYHIQITAKEPGRNIVKIVLDGVERPNKDIPLIDDRREHSVEAEVGH